MKSILGLDVFLTVLPINVKIFLKTTKERSERRKKKLKFKPEDPITMTPRQLAHPVEALESQPSSQKLIMMMKSRKRKLQRRL